MKYLINTSTDPYFNMAFDEFCLQQYECDEPFFYLWRNRPAVIIGLNQNAYSEVNLPYLNGKGITLARRVTGGGAVYHDLQNMNYTIVGKDVTPEPFAAALRTLGVPAELSGRNDIFVEGRKVSGYAARVWHDRSIVHGTMMYDVDLDTLSKVLDTPGSKMEAKGISSVKSRVANLKEYLPQFPSLDELQAKLQEILSDGDEMMTMSDEQIAQIKTIAREKFASWAWIYGHSHEADMSHKRKLACGTVEARVCVDRGLITRIDFAGDFLGDLESGAVSEALKGVKYVKDAVLEVLKKMEVSRHFKGTGPEDLTELIVNQ